MTFDEAFDILIDPQHEGGYSNDPDDPGAETMWGVTIAVARASGYFGAMRDLPKETAKAIARARYWVPAHCDEVPDAVRYDVFDTAYNAGVHEAIVLLQRCLGVADDGWWGPVTAAAAAGASPEPMRRLFNAERLSFYTKLKGWDHDSRGWANRVAANLRRP